MNAPAATQAEGGTLTKPAEWAVYMVTAALKCASDERTASHYVTADEAKHGILKTLNWFEAHDEYEWPDFARLNFDFSQVMRLRRALVQDVYNALQHAGNVKLGVPDTPDSHAGARRGRRSDAEGGTRGNNRKRLCKREAEIDEDAMSEQSQGHDEAQAILLEVMNQLMSRSKCDLLGHLSVDPVTRDASQLADMLHDRLVAAWDAPLREDSDRHDELKQKAETWDRLRRSVPPRSTQRERTATPHVSPTAPQATVPHATPSPATIKKISGGPAPGSGDPWDFHKRVFTAANSNPKNWADTHTAP